MYTAKRIIRQEQRKYKKKSSALFAVDNFYNTAIGGRCSIASHISDKTVREDLTALEPPFPSIAGLPLAPTLRQIGYFATSSGDENLRLAPRLPFGFF